MSIGTSIVLAAASPPSLAVPRADAATGAIGTSTSRPMDMETDVATPALLRELTGTVLASHAPLAPRLVDCSDTRTPDFVRTPCPAMRGASAGASFVDRTVRAGLAGSSA